MTGKRVEETAAPPWLVPLLATPFFFPCAAHRDSARGECNFFCLDCPSSSAFCFSCRTLSHLDHRVIQIRRSSYHDVVRVTEVQKALDISEVQTYVINSARVVFLNERPQPRAVAASPPSSSSASAAASSKPAAYSCHVCSRSLLDPFRFCSLGCKLEGIRRGVNACFSLAEDEEHVAHRDKNHVGSSNATRHGGGVASPPTSHHRRKGIPRRAALRS